MSLERNNLLRTAFDAYLQQLDEGELEPTDSYLPYDFDGIGSHQWHLLGYEMVKDELREITNILNQWHGLLQRWQAWDAVIRTYDTYDAWELRREFLEALAHHCLLMPSSIRDAFTFVATNSMHQVRLIASKDYPDYLAGDPREPTEKPKHLTRRKKEARLAELISIWPEAKKFMGALQIIDDKGYRYSTSDYRNRNTHSIGPRLGIGITRAVVRSVEPATMMAKQSDGTYKITPVSGKMSVSYGFGGTEPLNTEEARTANLDQYRRARECYTAYRSLLAASLVAANKTC